VWAFGRQQKSTDGPLCIFRAVPAITPRADEIYNPLDGNLDALPAKDPARQCGSVDNPERPEIIKYPQ
jgi:hypothetical protein